MNLREYRLQNNLTYREIGELTGMSGTHISKVENGKCTITNEGARKILDATDNTVTQIYSGSPKDKPVQP
ncbi:unnamed protein product [marine sediment metagenome]|uniref:HTH cro/C1-type domain-containing protein n=1 Tax=marine sediment metagenome TaxID=412755 RepID=X1CDQ5_9ZZZZ